MLTPPHQQSDLNGLGWDVISRNSQISTGDSMTKPSLEISGRTKEAYLKTTLFQRLTAQDTFPSVRLGGKSDSKTKCYQEVTSPPPPPLCLMSKRSTLRYLSDLFHLIVLFHQVAPPRSSKIRSRSCSDLTQDWTSLVPKLGQCLRLAPRPQGRYLC